MSRISKLDSTHNGNIYIADSTPNAITSKEDIHVLLNIGLKRKLGDVLLVS